MEKQLRYVAYLFIAIVGMVVFTALFLKLADAINASKNPGDLAAWVGALGTVGTLIAAIALATKETRNQRNEKRVLAELAAASFVNRIVVTTGHVTATLNHLRKWDGLLEDFQHCAELLMRNPPWTPQELVPLVPLPNNAAAKLAAAAANIIVTADLLVRAKVNIQGDEEAAEFYHQTVDALNEIRVQLNVGFVECHKVSQQLTVID